MRKKISFLFLIMCMCLFFGIISHAEGFTGIKYAYNETGQENVTVTVTISSDGMPIISPNGRVLSNVTVQVPYFDLRNYHMENFYRYATDAKCNYIGTTVIERPTLLHLYIYLIERFYLGYAEEDCGLGSGYQHLGKEQFEDVYNSRGDFAYSMFDGESGDGRSLLKYSGGAESFYMTNFWGHDENLNYYVNHQYPLMWTEWGATADYILLEDGDVVEVAMFTDWGFYTHGGFAFFGKDVYRLKAGNTLRAKTYVQGGSVLGDNNEFQTPAPEEVTDLKVYVYDSDRNQLNREALTYSDDGYISYLFDKPGTYYLHGYETNAGYDNASIAPASAKVIVGAEENIPVSSITVQGQHGITEVLCGTNLQMRAWVLPENAANHEVVWNVEGTGASIDTSGRVRAAEYLDEDQKIKVTALATDGSGVEGSLEITIKAKAEDVQSVESVRKAIRAIGNSMDDVVYSEACREKITAADRAYTEISASSLLKKQIEAELVQFLNDAKERFRELEEQSKETETEPESETQSETESEDPQPTPETETSAPTPETETEIPQPTPETETEVPDKTVARQTKASVSSIKIIWRKDKKATAGYRVYIKGGAFKKYTKVADYKAGVTSCTMNKAGTKKLKSGTVYKIKITSLTKNGSKTTTGSSQYLDAVTVTAKPAIVSVKKKKTGIALLTWKKIPGADGYEIRMKEGAKGKYKNPVSVSAKKTQYQYKKLKKGKTYYFQLRTYKKAGKEKFYSVWSTVKNKKM